MPFGNKMTAVTLVADVSGSFLGLVMCTGTYSGVVNAELASMLLESVEVRSTVARANFFEALPAYFGFKRVLQSLIPPFYRSKYL